MKKIVSIVCLSSFLVTNVCYAQEKPISLPKIEAPAEEKDVGPAISPMRKGQKAPFTGVLLSPEATSTVIVEYQDRKRAIDLEVNRTRDLEREDCRKQNTDAQIKNEEQKKVQQVRLDESLDTIKKLEAEIEKEKNDRPSRAFWAGLGAAGGVVATVLVVFAVNKASK
jgi:LPS O-antigen subunit length determinant protein (WzzB/FepE family)